MRPKPGAPATILDDQIAMLEGLQRELAWEAERPDRIEASIARAKKHDDLTKFYVKKFGADSKVMSLLRELSRHTLVDETRLRDGLAYVTAQADLRVGEIIAGLDEQAREDGHHAE